MRAIASGAASAWSWVVWVGRVTGAVGRELTLPQLQELVGAIAESTGEVELDFAVQSSQPASVCAAVFLQQHEQPTASDFEEQHFAGPSIEDLVHDFELAQQQEGELTQSRLARVSMTIVQCVIRSGCEPFMISFYAGELSWINGF